VETEATNGTCGDLPRKKEYAYRLILTLDIKPSITNIILKNVKYFVISILIVTFAETIKIVKI